MDGSCIAPDYCVSVGLSSVFVPSNDCFSLVCDTNGLNLMWVLLLHFFHALLRVFQQLYWIVLQPPLMLSNLLV